MAKKGIHINVYKLPDGTWRCDLKINTNAAGEGITVRGTSDDSENHMGSWWKKTKKRLSKAGQAVSKARIIAKALLSNPAIAQAFPQYVAPALATLQAIEEAEKHGALGKVKKQFQDPTLKKLATEMDQMAKGERSAMSGGGVCLWDGREKQTTAGHSPFGLSAAPGPFGLPEGNPHPFAAWVKNQIAQRNARDPLGVQKLARMQQYQRGMARASR